MFSSAMLVTVFFATWLILASSLSFKFSPDICGSKRCVGRFSLTALPRNIDVVRSLESEGDLMTMALTSAASRLEAPNGVVMVVGYFCMFDTSSKEFLESLSQLKQEFPISNVAKIAKQFTNGPDIMVSRLINKLPCIEIIADGKRKSVVIGHREGINAAKQALTEHRIGILKQGSDQATQYKADVFRADGDRLASGKFQKWSTGQASNSKLRLTSDFFPGSKQTSDLAENVFGGIERTFLQRIEEDED
jgi:hypothetical protein